MERSLNWKWNMWKLMRVNQSLKRWYTNRHWGNYGWTSENILILGCHKRWTRTAKCGTQRNREISKEIEKQDTDYRNEVYEESWGNKEEQNEKYWHKKRNRDTTYPGFHTGKTVKFVDWLTLYGRVKTSRKQKLHRTKKMNTYRCMGPSN